MRRESFQPIETDHAEPKRVRRKFVWWCIGGTLGAGLIIGAAYLLLWSDVFSATLSFPDMRFTSRPLVEKMVIAERMVRHPLLRLLGPDNILFWVGSESGELTAALAPALRGLAADVRVGDRTVAFSVQERSVRGVWCTIPPRIAEEATSASWRTVVSLDTGAEEAETHCYGFDDQGIVFTDAPSVSGVLILKVEDENGGMRTFGQHVLPREEWYEILRSALGILSESGIPAVLATVHDVRLHEWDAHLASGVTLRFSFDFLPENFPRVLENLRARLDFSDLSYIDFRVQNRIYYK